MLYLSVILERRIECITHLRYYMSYVALAHTIAGPASAVVGPECASDFLHLASEVRVHLQGLTSTRNAHLRGTFQFEAGF
jgi:hypothetical protein